MEDKTIRRILLAAGLLTATILLLVLAGNLPAGTLYIGVDAFAQVMSWCLPYAKR